jgi:GMP/IMP 5'-nucleotidase
LRDGITGSGVAVAYDTADRHCFDEAEISLSCTTPTILSQAAPPPRWEDIDTVLLDMDGTLLDLRFDNYFWLELIPHRYAARHGLTLQAAHAALAPRFAAKHGTLDWYCIDYWSRELSLDVGRLKREVSAQVRFLPGAEEFLAALGRRGTPAVLVTNAHRESLAIKTSQTGLTRYFSQVVSSHDFGVPKEHPQFWERLQEQVGFERARSLFVDDSLPVLRAARAHGIGQIYAISRPDATLPPREVAEFPAVECVEALLAGPG